MIKLFPTSEFTYDVLVNNIPLHLNERMNNHYCFKSKNGRNYWFSINVLGTEIEDIAKEFMRKEMNRIERSNTINEILT